MTPLTTEEFLDYLDQNETCYIYNFRDESAFKIIGEDAYFKKYKGQKEKPIEHTDEDLCQAYFFRITMTEEEYNQF